MTYRAGRSMFSTEGDLWRQKHEILQPMMNLSSLQFNTKIIHQKMNKLMKKISEFEENKGEEFEIEIIKYLKQVTLDVIGEFAFGVDFHALDDKVLFLFLFLFFIFYFLFFFNYLLIINLLIIMLIIYLIKTPFIFIFLY